MKKLFYLFLLFFLATPFYSSFAEKPFDEWNRNDVIEYFEANNIIFEGEYRNPENDLDILIGRLNSRTEKINMNFFLKEGKLEKALLTAYENKTFDSLQAMVEEQGFTRVAESNDKLGNQYSKFTAGSVDLTVVNKTADWPEVYFQP
jgi:hypothetical protein